MKKHIPMIAMGVIAGLYLMNRSRKPTSKDWTTYAMIGGGILIYLWSKQNIKLLR